MKKTKPVIGVLALQGAVDLHRPHIEAAGGEFRAVKTPAQFEEIDAFILPGGESTTMLKLIDNFGLWDCLKEQFISKPVWGICAGSILLAQEVLNPAQKSFCVLPITIQRNGYGRQLESHHTQIKNYTVSFIRAPVITKTDANVEILNMYNENPVWVKCEKAMATTFHPELTKQYPSPMHAAFLELVRQS